MRRRKTEPMEPPLPDFTPCAPGWRCAAYPLPGMRPSQQLIANEICWDYVNPVVGFVEGGGVILDLAGELSHDPNPEWLCDPKGRWQHMESGRTFDDLLAALAYAEGIQWAGSHGRQCDIPD